MKAVSFLIFNFTGECVKGESKHMKKSCKYMNTNSYKVLLITF